MLIVNSESCLNIIITLQWTSLSPYKREKGEFPCSESDHSLYFFFITLALQCCLHCTRMYPIRTLYSFALYFLFKFWPDPHSPGFHNLHKLSCGREFTSDLDQSTIISSFHWIGLDWKWSRSWEEESHGEKHKPNTRRP